MRPVHLVAAFLLACAQEPLPCAERATGTERDLCRYEVLKSAPPATIAEVAPALRAIDDPIVRSAALLEWFRDHPKSAGTEAASLCELLAANERNACVRRANSPHLHR